MRPGQNDKALKCELVAKFKAVRDIPLPNTLYLKLGVEMDRIFLTGSLVMQLLVAIGKPCKKELVYEACVDRATPPLCRWNATCGLRGDVPLATVGGARCFELRGAGPLASGPAAPAGTLWTTSGTAS